MEKPEHSPTFIGERLYTNNLWKKKDQSRFSNPISRVAEAGISSRGIPGEIFPMTLVENSVLPLGVSRAVNILQITN